MCGVHNNIIYQHGFTSVELEKLAIGKNIGQTAAVQDIYVKKTPNDNTAATVVIIIYAEHVPTTCV